MKVKATVSFAGTVSMAIGEVRDIGKDVAAPLIKCGYLEKVEKKDGKENENKGTAPDENGSGSGSEE